MSRKPGFFLLLLLLVAGFAVAQQVPLPPAVPGREAKAAAAAKTADRNRRLELARRDLDSGNADAAYRVLLQALLHRPDDPAVLAMLIEVAGDDLEAKILWAHRYAAAVTPANGAFRPPPSLRKHLPPGDPRVASVIAARARAAADLAAFAKKLKGRRRSDRLIGRWVAAMAREILRDAPLLSARHAAVVNRAAAYRMPDPVPIVNALAAKMTHAMAREDFDFALRAARCLNGLSTQAKLPRLEGPRPSSLGRARQGAEAMRTIRRRVARREDEPTTLQALEALSPAERRAYTTRHATMGNPGVCWSPRRRYRIETSCGIETLLEAARSVEHHHARLAAWFGGDPFVERPGVIRIVPEAEGLEDEGAPFWWVGGFQCGDETTVRVAWDTPDGLGRLLTHELTHRFDGHFHRGIPAWLAEGRAVWTQNAYTHTEARKFVEPHARIGTVERALLHGYGGEANLKKLIDGTLADYRDNYFAGYALYVYLSSWETNGKPLYASPLKAFTRSFGQRRGRPLRKFEKCFCTGKMGRPKDFTAFTKAFATFLDGFYWQDRKPWTERYNTVRRRGQGELFADWPTWTRLRTRAEPWFGEAQAHTAGALLLEAGNRAMAAAAWCWAMDVDEWMPSRAYALATLLDRLGERDGAWAVRAETRRRFPDAGPETGRPPFRHDIAGVWAYLRALKDAADGYARAGHAGVAAAFAADHDAVARLAGEPLLNRPPIGAAPLGVGRHPFHPPAEHLGRHGWIETGLSGHEERRVEDLWYFTGDGDLIVGRRRPRSTTGTADRHARQVDAFTRTAAWHPRGRSLIRTRIFPATSYVSGALVLGYTRRDRNIRVRFTGGDFLYSVGAREKKDTDHMFRDVHVAIDGLRPRDRSLWGAQPDAHVDFRSPRPSFRLEVLVDGATVHVWVEDRLVGTYRALDGAPIEGAIGFAASMGAYRAQVPTMVRLTRHPDHGCPHRTPALDPSAPIFEADEKHPLPIARLRNRPVSGLPVGKTGTLVVWMPEQPSADLKVDRDPEETDAFVQTMAATLLNRVDQRREHSRYTARVALAVPESASRHALMQLDRHLRALGLEDTPLVFHRWPQPPIDRTAKKPGPPDPLLLFIDPEGRLRAADRFRRKQRVLPWAVDRWCRITTEELLAQKPRPASTPRPANQ